MKVRARLFASYREAAEELPYLHYHGPVSPLELLSELTQYDFGLIPLADSRQHHRHLDSALPNKLYEYLAAGLPVIASDFQSLREFITQREVGFTFSKPSEIVKELSESPCAGPASNERFASTQSPQRVP